MNTKYLQLEGAQQRRRSRRHPRAGRGFIKGALAALLSLLIHLNAEAKPPPRPPSPLTLPTPGDAWREANATTPTAQAFAHPQRDQHLKLIWIPAPVGAGAAILSEWDTQFRAQDPSVQTLAHEPDHQLAGLRGVWGGVAFGGRAGFYFGFELPQGGVCFLLAEGPAADAAALRALLDDAAASLTPSPAASPR